MTATRWTVDDGDYLSCEGYGIAPFSLSDEDANAHFPDDVFDALRDAVRDADTLTQARQLAANLRPGWPAPGGDLGALLDLLTGDRP